MAAKFICLVATPALSQYGGFPLQGYGGPFPAYGAPLAYGGQPPFAYGNAPAFQPGAFQPGAFQPGLLSPEEISQANLGLSASSDFAKGANVGYAFLPGQLGSLGNIQRINGHNIGISSLQAKIDAFGATRPQMTAQDQEELQGLYRSLDIENNFRTRRVMQVASVPIDDWFRAQGWSGKADSADNAYAKAQQAYATNPSAANAASMESARQNADALQSRRSGSMLTAVNQLIPGMPILGLLGGLQFYQASVAEKALADAAFDDAQRSYQQNPSEKTWIKLRRADLKLQMAEMDTKATLFESTLFGSGLGAIGSVGVAGLLRDYFYQGEDEMGYELTQLGAREAFLNARAGR